MVLQVKAGLCQGARRDVDGFKYLAKQLTESNPSVAGTTKLVTHDKAYCGDTERQ